MTTSKPSKPKSRVQQIASSISSTTKVSAHDRQGTKGVTKHQRKKTQGQKDAELADRLLKSAVSQESEMSEQPSQPEQNENQSPDLPKKWRVHWTDGKNVTGSSMPHDTIESARKAARKVGGNAPRGRYRVWVEEDKGYEDDDE